MKNILLMLVISLTVVSIQGCNNNEDVTKVVSKNGSIESELSIVHFTDKLDILTTTHKVWIAGKTSKVIVHKDTIPSLGILNTEVENEQGDKSTVPLKKDYEFYVTVK